MENNIKLLEWVLWWPAQGIAVFPLHEVYDGVCTCICSDHRDKITKRLLCKNGDHVCGSECKSKGKHPIGKLAPRGVYQASLDPCVIRRWWTERPTANIGIAMGGQHRLVALDCDPRNGGSASICDLVEAHGEAWLDTFTQESGSGGHHFIYRQPDDTPILKGNQKNKLAPGIDTKTAGGYLVAAPSIHESGRRYQLKDAKEISLTPQFFFDFLTQQPTGCVIDFQEARERRSFSESGKEKFPEGERNDRLFGVLIGRWRHGWAIDMTELHAQAIEINRFRCVPPLDDGEVTKIAASVAYGYPHLRAIDAQEKTA